MKAWDFAAGDLIVYVDGDGVQHTILSVEWNNVRTTAEGVEIYEAGIDGQEERVLLFLKSYLESQGISSFDLSGYFLIEGSRWDFSEGEAVQGALGPLGASHHVVQVLLRKAIETENAVVSAEFGFDA